MRIRQKTHFTNLTPIPSQNVEIGRLSGKHLKDSGMAEKILSYCEKISDPITLPHPSHKNN
ncbi:hypothetical protein SDJN02_11349, partial [Cucurbita argyrosperma subsp. argyrosperma]